MTVTKTKSFFSTFGEKSRNSYTLDLLLLTISLVFAFFLLSSFYDLTLPPFEDAAMIMRYADHIAEGHGMVWNVGEAPVDGATDFLFTMMVAGLVKIGLTAEFAVRWLVLLSHFVAFWVIYLFLVRFSHFNRAASLILALLFLIGPGLSFVGTYFGAPVFALFVLVLWLLTIGYAKGMLERHPAWYGITALVVGLTRPEGVLLGFFMIVALIWYRGWRECREIVFWYLGIMLVFGGGYLVWRWSYFGYPLPNPFYKKGGFALHYKGFVKSAVEVIRFGWFYFILAATGLYWLQSRRKVLFHLIPVVAFTAIWILISDEMNFAGRFQYPLLPMMLVSMPFLVSDRIKQMFLEFFHSRFRQISFTVVAISLVVLISFQLNRDYLNTYRDGRIKAANIMKQFQDKGYKLATSEAGLLPYFSGWKTLDTWGLNDKWIAHNFLISEEYLAAFNPDVIMFHGYFSPLSPLKSATEWDRMTTVLYDYARKNCYKLIACYGVKGNDTHQYYIKAGLPDGEVLTEMIRNLQYCDYKTGEICTNFAQ